MGINCTRIGYIVDTLTSVGIQELIKIGGKVIEKYEGVNYRENFKVSPFKILLITFSNYDENIRMKIMMLCRC